MTSPSINKLTQSYDLHVYVGEVTLVNFLLQYPLSQKEVAQIHAIYDEDQLEIGDIEVMRYARQTLVTTRIKSKDLGSLDFRLAIPYRASVYEELALDMQFS